MELEERIISDFMKGRSKKGLVEFVFYEVKHNDKNYTRINAQEMVEKVLYDHIMSLKENKGGL